jgi:hypothetical protein
MSGPRAVLLTLAGLIVMALAGPAAAEIAVNAPGATPNLGGVIITSGTTSFSISTAGVVTRTSGTGVRLSSANVTMPSATVSCGLLNLDQLCILRLMRITVTPVASAGPVTVTQLRISGLTNAGYWGGVAPAAGSTVTFVLNPITIATISFKVGMDIAVAAGAATGNQTFGYTVTAEFVP